MKLRNVVETAMSYTGNPPYGGEIQDTHWGPLKYRVVPRAGGYIPPRLQIHREPYCQFEYDLGNPHDLQSLGI